MKSDYTMDHLPIPPQTTRISVQLGDILHRLDVPSDRFGDCLDDFEGSFTLPLRTYRGTVAGIITVGEIARNAAACGYKLTMTQAVSGGALAACSWRAGAGAGRSARTGAAD